MFEIYDSLTRTYSTRSLPTLEHLIRNQELKWNKPRSNNCLRSYDSLTRTPSNKILPILEHLRKLGIWNQTKT